MNFPDGRPDVNPKALDDLQRELLALAEDLLGRRDGTKNIGSPVFHQDGPFIRNTPDLDGAHAELSPHAAASWRFAVYQLAHETVHLLNPTVGCTNWLEEGVAVAFALHAVEHYKFEQFQVKAGTYAEALKLVQELPGDSFAVAQSLRKVAGSLAAVQVEHLAALVPDHQHEKLQLLASECKPR